MDGGINPTLEKKSENDKAMYAKNWTAEDIAKALDLPEEEIAKYL